MNKVVSSLKIDSTVPSVCPPTPVPYPLPGSATSTSGSTILVIENDIDALNLLAVALVHTQLPVQVYPVFNLADAQSYLLGTGCYNDRNQFPEPYLIMANSRFPSGSLSEFISWVRHHPTLRSVPIIVHSGEVTPEQRGELYQRGANFCLTIPDNPVQLAQQLTSIHKILQHR